MTEKKTDETTTGVQYGDAGTSTKHAKGQAPTQSQFNGVAAPQTGTEDLPKGL